MLTLLGSDTEIVINARGNCVMRRFIMDSPAVHLLDCMRVVKSRKGRAYITRECLSRDMCTWLNNKNPGIVLQEQIRMT